MNLVFRLNPLIDRIIFEEERRNENLHVLGRIESIQRIKYREGILVDLCYFKYILKIKYHDTYNSGTENLIIL